MSTVSNGSHRAVASFSAARSSSISASGSNSLDKLYTCQHHSSMSTAWASCVFKSMSISWAKYSVWLPTMSNDTDRIGYIAVLQKARRWYCTEPARPDSRIQHIYKTYTRALSLAHNLPQIYTATGKKRLWLTRSVSRLRRYSSCSMSRTVVAGRRMTRRSQSVIPAQGPLRQLQH